MTTEIIVCDCRNITINTVCFWTVLQWLHDHFGGCNLKSYMYSCILTLRAIEQVSITDLGLCFFKYIVYTFKYFILISHSQNKVVGTFSMAGVLCCIHLVAVLATSKMSCSVALTKILDCKLKCSLWSNSQPILFRNWAYHDANISCPVLALMLDAVLLTLEGPCSWIPLTESHFNSRGYS